MTIIARRTSVDNGLTAVVERIHATSFALRYWPKSGEPDYYHECAIIDFFDTAVEALTALDEWAGSEPLDYVSVKVPSGEIVFLDEF
ncbi:MAG: hypothetical protein ACR2OV_00280 [Hyphomicrobiaceae bacterium]